MKKRIAKLAKRRKTTPHASMLEEARATFHAEATRRLRAMKKTGMAIPADEVFEYLKSLGKGKPAARPKARKLA